MTVLENQMTLNAEDVKKIAHLARLHVSDPEISSLGNDLERILELVATMNEAKTQSVAPLAHPLDEIQPLRPDQVTEINQRDLFQQIAPQTNAGLYIVPKVIEAE